LNRLLVSRFSWGQSTARDNPPVNLVDPEMILELQALSICSSTVGVVVVVFDIGSVDHLLGQ